MANLEVPRRGTDAAAGPYVLGPGTLISAAIAVCLAQVALAIPAVLNGMFTKDPAPSSSQLTWITAARDSAAVIVTVLGMFAFLGIAYATSIRLSAIQGFSPLKTSIAFLFLNGMALVLLPVTARLLEEYNPKWPLGAGCALMGAGAWWLAATPATDLSLAPVIIPFILAGAGFALAVSSVTAVAVNTVPNHLGGMASGATNMLRDFGFTLGPVIVGAVALAAAVLALAFVRGRVHETLLDPRTLTED